MESYFNVWASKLWHMSRDVFYDNKTSKDLRDASVYSDVSCWPHICHTRHRYDILHRIFLPFRVHTDCCLQWVNRNSGTFSFHQPHQSFTFRNFSGRLRRVYSERAARVTSIIRYFIHCDAPHQTQFICSEHFLSAADRQSFDVEKNRYVSFTFIRFIQTFACVSATVRACACVEVLLFLLRDSLYTFAQFGVGQCDRNEALENSYVGLLFIIFGYFFLISALAVRFLTRRYIGEYDHQTGKCDMMDCINEPQISYTNRNSVWRKFILANCLQKSQK